ncbi:ABC-type branched-subunit amino acid transport system substrate-binding protein [Flavobacterium tiangeerense]|uniref:ABC-type branched-subunit amino acid transport system substrate-binding protein n=1 Tax=Flavobacterium tiangeerense TaxID=459471 RepID=A0ABY3FKG4_9FLAO|nr:LysM peptidoglycan-binding domain-containing protein [Flavobacterium tiangeerense]TWH99362.1 ABC-type branched-subunit amino acid transport system substrate-binding protein [Flavobacterium tiangeerense]
MKYFLAVCMTALWFNLSTLAQSKATTHKVEKGETINSIAQKYKVTPYDIYQLNPDVQKGLQLNSILLIPSPSAKKAITLPVKKEVTSTKHVMAPKETLYGILKKYDVTTEELQKVNPLLDVQALKIGQVLVIPSKTALKSNVPTQEKAVKHIVLAKETKYSIANKYGITIEELERKNPEIVSNLPIGYELIIKGNPIKIAKSVIATEVKKESVQVASAAVFPKGNFISYVVRPKETLYSLSKMSGLSQEELLKENPALANGVEVGMEIKIPESATITPVEAIKKEFTVLAKKNNERKKLALLLPFNVTKIENDTVNSITARLKKDKFLNMTLDFYSGALMAIDSAKTLGLNVEIKILDSQESKNSSAVAALTKSNNLEESDAIIGPFYQANVEKMAELVLQNQVPVVSPLSKENEVKFANIFQSVPNPDAVKNAMFDYMRTKGGNMIAVVDKKKGSVIKFISDNHKDVRFVPLTATGGVSAESIKSLLVKDKMNYVVMETENTGMIKATLSALMSAMATYKVQLVILEPNETLDTDEINFSSLTKLKLMYPAVSRENESPEALIFEKEYKKKNKVYPSVFATRGFDVTFDTLLRLSQGKKFEETTLEVTTEQVDNKFDYSKNTTGGYSNNGIYILYYDTDLTIKEAK